MAGLRRTVTAAAHGHRASCGTCPYILLGGPRCFGDMSMLALSLQRRCVSAEGVRTQRKLYRSSLLTVYCPGVCKLAIEEKRLRRTSDGHGRKEMASRILLVCVDLRPLCFQCLCCRAELHGQRLPGMLNHFLNIVCAPMYTGIS